LRRRLVLDASMMGAVLNMDEPAHQESYSYFRNLHDADAVLWVVPGLLFFEVQAIRARRFRKGTDTSPIYQRIPLFEENCEIYEITADFLRRVWELDLYRKFGTLKGADLLYACIAFVEQLPLVTLDRDFDRHRDLIEIIRPGFVGA
jgi:predicted nucleic acid-binding protein